jgi:hypothetical protein
LSVAALVSLAASQTPLGTAFTYQGQLTQAGQPYNGTANLVFDLYDAASGGNLLGTQTLNSVPVNGGLFTILLNGAGEFGASAFNGDKRWLDITVNGTLLTPRQELTAVPYATLAVGLALPFSGSSGVSGAALAITNSSTGAADFGVVGTLTSASGVDLTGQSAGVWGDSSSGQGVIGTSSALYGAGVLGKANNVGVYGTNPTGGAGVYGDSVTGTGVVGYASAASGQNYGVAGQSDSDSGYGVSGLATAGAGTANFGVVGTLVGPSGIDLSGLRAGVWGDSSVGDGVLGTSGALYGAGVVGKANNVGVYGTNPTGGAGVYGDSVTGFGVYGVASASSGTNYGVYGVSNSTIGIAVKGTCSAGTGVSGESTSGLGVYGVSSSGYAGKFESTSNTAVYGISYDSSSSSNDGGYFAANSQYGSGVAANTTGQNAAGVFGLATHTTGFNWGVYGRTYSGTNGFGVFSDGRFGSSGTKSFQIDHPLDPENKYLSHYCAEGPEPQNIYNGLIALDAAGEAWVELPAYFASINREPRYTLTAVGAAMPNLHVAQEVDLAAAPCRFRIAGGAAGGKVSWEVKAIRNDLWVQRYGAPVETDKTDEERGKYQRPELYGQPKEMGIWYHPEPETLPAARATSAETESHVRRTE